MTGDNDWRQRDTSRNENHHGCPTDHQTQDPPPMMYASRFSSLALLLITVICLVLTGCTGDRVEAPPTAEEQILLGQITRDRFVKIIALDRNDLEQLVVTTQQGSVNVRYVLKPARPGDANLLIHKLNDRSVLTVEDSAQLGTGPQPGSRGHYR